MSDKLDKLLRKRHRSNAEKQTAQIRRVLLTEGLTEHECLQHRPLLWKVLLRLPTTSLHARPTSTSSRESRRR
jgi:hypothetical protein